MIKKINLKIFFIALVLGLFVAGVTHGQGLVGCRDDCQIKDLILMIISIINFLLSLASLVCMAYIVWAGWNLIVAQGNEEQLSSAKKGLSNAIIGLFLILVAYVLLDGILLILSGFTLNQTLEFILGKQQ